MSNVNIGFIKMPKKKEQWNPTCERFVAFLDIMGFRDMVVGSTHQSVYQILKSFRPTIDPIEYAAKRTLARKGVKTSNGEIYYFKSIVRPIVFSDSIILITADDSEDGAYEMFFNIEWVIRNAIRQGIPIKGAIAHGKQTADFNKSLHFGKPLIYAYELQNELLLYGAVLHHSMEKRLVDIGKIQLFDSLDIYRYPVPMKSGKINHYIVDWIGDSKNSCELVSNLYNSVSGKPRKYVDNTIEFLKWLKKEKARLKKNK